MANADKPPPDEQSSQSSRLFMSTVTRTTSLAINKASAGAGVLGLVGFAALTAVAGVFFVTENFFIAMVMMSFALLVYVTGAELAKLFLTSFTVFFSSKHVIAQAAYLQETLVPLRRVLQIRRDPEGNIKAGPLLEGMTVKLPDNPLVRDIQILLEKNPDYEYAEYIAHSYYVQCHEVYDHSSAHLEFVATAMPMFGLIATIIGLIGMFEGLGADVTVEFLSPQLALALKCTLYGALLACVYKIVASRFDQRIRALDYDFETFCRALQVLIDNKAVIEVRS
jgi:biopolymer transport protein ExbB/TolQ